MVTSSRVAGVAGPEPIGVGTVGADPHLYVGGKRRQRLQQDLETFAFLVAPEEEHGPSVGRPGLDRREPLDLDPVEHPHVGPTEVFQGQGLGLGRDRRPHIETSGQPSQG